MENQLIDILLTSDKLTVPIVLYILFRQIKLIKTLNNLELEITLIKNKVCKK